ncbi:PREDICTED: condensin-2 complex subunit H2 [Thamnophis sirtalis]|uniref:Condensin-2 complex subunit H2 n=1 Tax=Thamnophis sirtalis TaxID=35019 RepID=A0A6I9XVN6_9SAUR|nr:PREDICTED: condensin-2 complex subunit H2 [Thamnophis sirtalis]
MTMTTLTPEVSVIGQPTALTLMDEAVSIWTLMDEAASIWREICNEVEYLYTLVYQALDFISSKKREKQPTSVGADGTDGDVSAGPGAAAEEEEFLSLDDIQQASRANMELRDDQQHNTVPIVPLTPMALVPPEESEKKDNPLFSRKGELLASRKDFRMNTCTPHHNGLFVLELAGLSPTQCQEGRDSVRSLAPTAGSMPMESAPRSKGYALRERLPALDANPHLKDTWDPWRSLDPFSSSEDKPFKKGRPFTVPRGLEDWSRAKRKRRPSGKLEDFVSWFSSSDLEVLYWRNMKERLAAQRRLQKRMGLHLEAQLEELGAHEMDREEEEEEDLDAAAAADDGPDPGGIPSSLSYEELVNRNVELFMAHSQKYARETVLSRRVRDWEEMMGPQLEEQEARAAFDIHKYGDQLVSRFSRVGEWHSFASLMAGQPAFEICRAMLASLQLANDYTVEISQGPGLEEAVDTMALRLLTQEKAHQRFHTYTAPSLSKQ